ncbi:MAG: glutamate synthase subunit alpha, partial [Gammaproteobacteria bacterium]|nr:glutamate synthase subunit alpha [Gammaproteobacteria bacterium]
MSEKNTVFNQYRLPKKHGLYNPENETENCGVGFVAHIKGEPSHQIVEDADHILRRMVHRGACGCEANTGDGAGIMTGLPYAFLTRVAKEDLGADLPAKGQYAAGNVFLPVDEAERAQCKKLVNKLIAASGQKLIGWRELPVDPIKADIGPTARHAMPHMEQLFVAAADGVNTDDFERKLYVLRKNATHTIRADQNIKQADLFYFCSLSTKVIVYKGMLNPDQMMPFYTDLNAEDFTSHLAMVHSRFSTNTFPSWDRAQPKRFMSHNGEINTRLGNANWMTAREGTAESDLFGDDIKKILPVIEPEVSDSGSFDNVLEFLLMGGRSLQEAVMMMVPEAWQNDASMSEEKRAFYEYQSALMEPWDGPASIVFTDGRYIGATLDRNGLRPSRYYLTHDDRVIMASEVGVLPVDSDNVKFKGRLQPGKMFLIDFDKGRMIPDEELKHEFAKKQPYHQWLSNQRIALSQLEPKQEPHGFYQDTLLPRMRAFGYTSETMQFMLMPLVKEGRDPVG